MKPSRFAIRCFWSVIISLLGSQVLVVASAHASTLCDYYRDQMPALYSLNCRGLGGGKTSSATGSATAADSFSNNPSGLPTSSTSYGIETIESYTRFRPTNYGPTFSIIKGFHKVGAGVTTSSNNSFFGNDMVQRKKGHSVYNSYQPIEPEQSNLPPLSFATAIEVISAKSKKPVTLSLGVSTRFNNVTNTLGYGLGFLTGAGPLTFGLGLNLDRVTSEFSWVHFYSAILGIKLLLIDVEYNRLWNVQGYTLEPIHIVSASLPLGRFLFSAAKRWATFDLDGKVVQYHYAMQVRLSKKFTAAYLYNYIPGSNSGAIQFYF